MSEEITASYTFSADALLPAYDWHQRRKLQIRLGVFIIFGVGCLVSFFSGFSSGREVPTSIYVGGSAAFLLIGWLIWMALKYANRFFCGRRIKAMPVCGKQVKWVISDTALRCFLSGADSTTQWNLILESVQAPDGVLIYPQRNLFYWLPKTAFTSDSDYTRFLELIAAKTKHSKIG